MSSRHGPLNNSVMVEDSKSLGMQLVGCRKVVSEKAIGPPHTQ